MNSGANIQRSYPDIRLILRLYAFIAVYCRLLCGCDPYAGPHRYQRIGIAKGRDRPMRPAFYRHHGPYLGPDHEGSTFFRSVMAGP